MARSSSLILLTLLALVCFLAMSSLTNPQPLPPPAPTLQMIREAVELSVLEVDVSAITTTRLAGYTGQVRCCLIIQGTARIGTALDQASVASINHDAKSLTIKLPQPTVLSVRIDPVATQFYSIDRSGMWALLPFDTREGELIAAAWSQAEQRLRQVAEREALIRHARERTLELITTTLNQIGWSATVEWKPP